MSTAERMRYAVALGHTDASLSGVVPRELSDDWQTVVEEGCKLLPERAAIEFGLECVLRSTPSWTRVFPEDHAVPKAIECVQLWLGGRQCAVDAAAASGSASDAAIEADDPDRVPTDDALIRAIHAANAVSSLADAAESASHAVAQRRLGPDAVAMALGYAASFSLQAATNGVEEEAWQRMRLREFIVACDEMS